MADDYAIFKNEFRPVNFAFLEEKIVCPHPSCEGEAVFFQKKRTSATLQDSTSRNKFPAENRTSRFG